MASLPPQPVADAQTRATEAAHYVGSAAWEDPGHVVYTVFADGGWSVWRLGIDGEAEQLTDPVPGEPETPPIQFVA